MIADILTEDDLCEISGHWTREGLKEWLKLHGVAFLLAKNGWPRVHVKALEKAMGVGDVKVVPNKLFDFNFENVR